jgi:hypothetical protein
VIALKVIKTLVQLHWQLCLKALLMESKKVNLEKKGLVDLIQLGPFSFFWI